jgi:hypothetical protein
MIIVRPLNMFLDKCKLAEFLEYKTLKILCNVMTY